MSTPLKDNNHIRADPDAFMAAFARAREKFGRVKGVVGVAHGLKERAGRFSEDSAIIIYVSKKRPEAELPPEQCIPPTFEGYRTDVRVMLPIKNVAAACNDSAPHAVITGGIQIKAISSHPPPDPIGAGTLGCIVHKRGDTGADNVYLLTCEHVLLDPVLGTEYGDGVYQPSRLVAPSGETSGTLLGKIEQELVWRCHVDSNGRPVLDEPDAGPPNPAETDVDPFFDGFYVDCAVVRIDLGSFCCGSACTRNDVQYATTIPSLNLLPPPAGIDPGSIDRITDVRDLRKESPPSLHGLRVIKNGRSTARSVGKITAAPAPGHNIILDHIVAFHYNVIEIALEADPPATNPCTGTNAFCAGGDSGSIVVDEQNRAIGLIFAAREHPNDAGVILSYACFIVPVLDVLGVCIPTTTGTSHGSSRAIDGSGLAQYGGASDLPPNDDRTLFAAHGASGAPRIRKPPPPLVAPATDEQRARMLPLLEALRETAPGRELQDAFSQLSREIAWLVRHSRPVKLAWHRNRGPAFLTCLLNHLKGDAATIPHEIDGVSRVALLERMGKVLWEHGSNPLREAIERHRQVLMSFANANTTGECIELLRRAETVETTQ